MKLPAFLLLCLCALPLAATAAVPIKLQPYRAVYDLELQRARGGSGIVGLSGRMVLEWADACEGYTLTQRMGFRLSRIDGGESLSDIRGATWESKDGRQFRYNVRTSVNGAVVEEFRGSAELRGARRDGMVTITSPEPMVVDLPPGTVFPSRHTYDLVEGALAGENRIARTVFEGSAGETVYETVAFLGDVIPPEKAATPHALLKGLDSWRVQIAYFARGSSSDLPEYEVGLRLFANGIGDDVELDYGNFVVAGVLTDLVALPDSGC